MTLPMKLLRYSGVAAVMVLWIGILVAMRLSGLSFLGQLPLSHLGLNEYSMFVFSSTLITAALLLISFGVYLKQQFNPSRGFMLVYMSGQLAQIVAALVPYGGESKIVHTIAAFALAFSLPLLMWLFARSQTVLPPSLPFRLFWLESACFMIGIGFFVLTNRLAPIAQALPAIAFHTWLISLSFYDPSTES